ncbi:DUF2391 family protein [Candidatus Woesearchaeota archaeon]|nr:DUF2391 family protein [Candidatus Woesearchaeota archaeon]
MASLQSIADEVDFIKKLLLKEVPPEHFSMKDIVRSFFGAAFIGSTFIFSRLLIEIPPLLATRHVIAIVVSTLAILTAEIYYIGYQRVENKKARPFGQFWLKRLLTFYAVSIIVSSYLALIYNVIHLVGGGDNVIKLIVAMSLPCSIGASITDLLKKY